MCFVNPHRSYEPDPNDPRAQEIRDAVRGAMRDGEVFLVYRAGAEVGAHPIDAPWFARERTLDATHPDLHGRLLAVQGTVERGYGWGPTVGVWAGVLAVVVLIQSGWLGRMIDAGAALETLRSGWVYFLLFCFGAATVGWVHGFFAKRTLKAQVPVLRRLAASNGMTEAELLSRIHGGHTLWGLQQKLTENPTVWVPTDD